MSLFDDLFEMTPSQAFWSVLAMIGAVWMIANVEVKIELTPQPVTDCIDGELKQWDGKRWHPVYIRKTKRPVPCHDEK